MASGTIGESRLGLLSSAYWRESRRPLASLAFILPLLALYEGGVLVLGARAMRNGADVWLRRLLDALGFGQYLLLPLLTICLLLAWHHTTGDRWRLSAGVVYAMYAECVLLGLVLLAIGHLQGALVQSIDAGPVPASLAEFVRFRWLGRLVGFFGAGIYEEVLFRLMLLPAAIGLLKLAGVGANARVVSGVVATSLLFSLAHYIGAQGESFEAFSFVFRFLAGGFFAIVFVSRGFGIAAGTHALYDIFAGMF